MPSLSEITDIQQELFAEDVKFEYEALAGLTEDEIRAYFESGGKQLPAAATPTPAATGVYALDATLISGAGLSLASFMGKPSMIINVASK